MDIKLDDTLYLGNSLTLINKYGKNQSEAVLCIYLCIFLLYVNIVYMLVGKFQAALIIIAYEIRNLKF